jgi:hypothetical protein
VIRDQPDGRLVAVRKQLGRYTRLTQTRIAEHYTDSQLAQRTAFLLGS